jgi:GAF domain-containing protein
VFPTGAPYSEVALQRYATLLDVADVVCSHQRPAELFRDLLPRLQSAVPCDLLNYAIHDPSRETIHMYLWNGGEPWPDVAEEIAVEESAAVWVWRNQQSLTLDDVEGKERFKPCLLSLRLRGMRSYCVLPLTNSDRRLGSLGIASAQIKAFGAPEEQFLLRVAEMVALSIDNTQAQSALLEEKERIRLLLDLGNFQAGLADQRAPELEERISQFLEPLQKWAGSGYVGLYLYDKDTSRTIAVYVEGQQRSEL